jgi:hypothetical protein
MRTNPERGIEFCEGVSAFAYDEVGIDSGTEILLLSTNGNEVAARAGADAECEAGADL